MGLTSDFEFNRREAAGALGDLGTILPLALGMILVNGLSVTGLFFSVGLFYIFTGLYFRITVPVQPMKVIGAYSVATLMSPDQIMASALLMTVFLAIIGLSGAIDLVGRYTPKAVIRGVQLSTGILLMTQGVKMMVGTSKIQVLHQAAEPYLGMAVQNLAWVGAGLGVLGSLLTLFLLDSRKIPAAIALVGGGLAAGLALGGGSGLSGVRPGVFMPDFMPFGFPSGPDFAFACFALVLPQVPMTLGNAVIANKDLANTYFGEKSGKMTYKSLCLSMAAGNLLSFITGGMPMCHGAGGLGAHYRFGARTAGSNLIIGCVITGLVLFLGKGILPILSLIPLSVLGVLLVFSGSQLAMTIQDADSRKDIFVVVCMLALTLAVNLTAAFAVGLVLSNLLKSKHFSV